jgi:predicted nucleic acid-binding protein
VELVDTNVLLYAVSSDSADAAKMEVANSLLGERDIAFSVQVLQEFYWQATHPSGQVRLSPEDATKAVRGFAARPIQDLTPGLVLAAIATAKRFQIAYWDAAIIEAARALGCLTVLTEDLQHRMDFDGVRVENPFRNL